MSNPCPCCGKPLAQDKAVSVDLNTNHIVVDGTAIQLTAKEAEIAEILIGAMPVWMHRDRILTRLYGCYNDPPEIGILNTFACNIRKKTKGTALRVETNYTGNFRVRLVSDADKIKSTMKTVAIRGMVGALDFAGSDFGDPEIWTCSLGYRSQPNVSRVYNLDPLSWFQSNAPEYIDEVNALGAPVIMQKHYEEIPTSVPYPRQEVLDFFGMTDKTAFFTSTICWMLADAIREGYERIIIHRVQESDKATDYFFQKPCLDFWCGVCIGRRVNLMISDNSLLCRPHPWESGLYGYVTQDSADLINATLASAVRATSRLPVTFRHGETQELIANG